MAFVAGLEVVEKGKEKDVEELVLCVFRDLVLNGVEKDLIEENLLTKIEKDYILNYHLETYSKISPFLNNIERRWLAKLI